jgi:hypothetical protein
MNAEEISTLIRYGATDKARRHLKKLGIYQRLKTLQGCVPYVNATKSSLKFFKENFSVEIGAIMAAEQDLNKAERLYRAAKSYK